MQPIQFYSNFCNFQKVSLGLALWIMACLPSACSSAAAPVPVSTITTSAKLTPYHTASPQPSLAVIETAAPEMIPTPSPTPRQHIVRQGEDMGGIAYRYRVTLAALLAANPEVNPAIMRVGMALVIPPSEGGTPAELPSDPTPVGITLGAVKCYSAADNGVWCFVLAVNNLETAVENPAATVRLVDRSSGTMISARADAPLNLLMPGQSLPLAAHFAPPAPIFFDAAADLITALPLAEPGQRYIPLQVENPSINLHPGSLAASVAGEIVGDGIEGGASSVWIVLVAVDTEGDVVGLRRWESSSPLGIAQRLPFSATVYSAGGLIAEVNILVEGRR
jgi:LysM repeat protein